MKRAYKAGKQPILNNKTTTLAVRRYHHNQLSVKKVVKLANQVGQRNLAKKFVWFIDPILLHDVVDFKFFKNPSTKIGSEQKEHDDISVAYAHW